MPFDAIIGFHVICMICAFAIGSVVGSFVNVCVFRIPWQTSVLWPGSHCPRCLTAIAARDNIPILGWLFLHGRCRRCAAPISARYPLIEALVGTLFVLVYASDVLGSSGRLFDGPAYARMAYHQLLVVFLVIATFIDFDYYIIPDAVTVTGMVTGLLLGTLMPEVRPAPAHATNPLDGLIVGLLGWAVGGGLVWGVRLLGGVVFRKEAMGFGDVTLLAMIGSFTGWQVAVLTFFLAPYFGIVQAIVKLARKFVKMIRGKTRSEIDGEVPFGPYLSMAALTLVLLWPKIWSEIVAPWFDKLKAIFA